MVDELLSFSESKVISSFTINRDNILSDSYFLTESGLIENMAQTVALHTGYDYFLKNKPAPTGYIGSIKKIEIIQLPEINEKIVTEVEILHEFMGVTLVDIFVLNRKKEKIAYGQMKTVIAN